VRCRNSGARVLAAAGIAFLALPGAQALAAPRVHTVVIDKMKFGPVPTNIRVGDTILWVNRDLFRHTATAKDKSFNLVLPPKSSGKTIIRRSGTVPFYCVYHPGMKGALTVAK
jgi:plastocyanin